MDPNLLPILAQTRQVSSRTGILQPFVWILVSLLAALGGFVKVGAATWLLGLLSVLLSLVVVAILVLVAVLVKRQHYHAMLSERFNLGAMALGAQKFGNSEDGSFKTSTSMTPTLPFEKVPKMIDVTDQAHGALVITSRSQQTDAEGSERGHDVVPRE